jgi:hypothetical protein
MIARLVALLLLAAAWVAALWLLILPDFAKWSLPQLIGSHLGPPLLVWGGGVFWLRRRRERLANAAAEREAVAEAERQARLEEVRQQHFRQLEQQRFHCDCRAVAFSQVLASPEFPEPLMPEDEQVSCSLFAGLEDAEPEEALLDQLRPGLVEAMQTIYQGNPAAAVFPIYVQPPAECSGEAVLACVREIRAGFVADAGLTSDMATVFDRALFLPDRGNAADSVLSLFESDPELPGALVLAFDSPWWRDQISGADWDPSPERIEARRWLGQAGQGVVALLLTSRNLPEQLAQLNPDGRRQHDALTPYWERDLVAGAQFLLSILDEPSLARLQQSTVLARIHRAGSQDFGPRQPRSMEFARGMQGLIERAQIHAALLEPAAPDGEVRAAETVVEECASGSCEWLIHNAGDVDLAGNRLAALGVALYNRGIDLDPIGAATNITVRAGDFGLARSLAMLGMAVARVVDTGSHCLCAEFAGDSQLALYFAAPAEAVV